MASAHNRLLSGLQRARELADDDPAVLFAADDAAAALADAHVFCSDVQRVLVQAGIPLAPR